MTLARANNLLQLHGGHSQANDGDLLLVQLPEPDAAEYPIDDAMLRKSIDEDVFEFFAHSYFPALFAGLIVATSAKGKTSTALTYVASELSRPPTKYGDMCAQVDSSAMRFVPNPGTLSGTHPYNPRSSILHLGAFA